MRFRILGPIEITNGAGPIALDAPKQRALLGVLLLHPNETVATNRLIDELWGDRPPATATKVVQTYVSQIRRLVGADTIATQPPGYVLRLDAGALDATDFRRLTGEGRDLAASGDHTEATRRFREALALWRGPPLADVVFESFARTEVERLEEERLDAVMDLIDCEIALGRYRDVVGELEVLTGQHPYRERPHAQLMLALYGSGRQAEALELYRKTRRTLVEELGIEPGPALQRIQRAILTQEPVLPETAERPTGEAALVPRREESGPPAGTVTFLFTDVEASTRLVQDLGASRYGEVLDAHRSLVRGAFRELGGTEVDTQGDSFFAVFRSASQAVQAATRVQRAVAEHRWPANAPLRVRIGIHTGEATVVNEGYRGIAVHRAARICTSAHGGQVLLSSTTRDLVESDLPAGVGLRDVGLVQLRGIDRPERLFQLDIEGLPETFPPPRAPAQFPLHRVDLLERDAELAALDALIGAVPAGGRILAIEGPPGIGKTRLLTEARTRAQAAGLRVLTARGSEFEREFSYGAVRQLFEPLLALAPDEERAELLAGAAELATPIFDPARLGTNADLSLSMLHGLFWLTANLTTRRPALLVLDDLHWCDPPSLRWLAYLLPRMEDLPLLIVVGLRPAEPEADVAVLGQITTDPLATVVRPGALSEEATGELIGHLVPADIDGAFRAACHEASGGNPLLVRELASTVAVEGLAPTAENVPRLHDLGGRAVSRTVSLRLSRLPPEATRLAHAVAILGDEADLGHAAALVRLEEATASDAAANLGRVEILRRRVPLSFVHPVVRSAVYAELSAAEKDQGHARAARLLADSGAEPERVAAQLLLTRPAGAAWAVSILRDAGRYALARGAADSAVAYLRRALEEPPGEETPAVLHELGAAEARVAAPEAIEHLAAARAATSDVRIRARIALELADALFALGEPPKKAVEVLEEATRELSDDDLELAMELDTKLIGIARFEPGLQALAAERLESLRVAAPRHSAAEQVALANLASEALRTGTRKAEALDLARRALAGGTLREHFDPEFIYAAQVLVYADELDSAFRLYSEALEAARKSGRVTALCFASSFRSAVAFRRGWLPDAVADAELALGLIDSHRLTHMRPFAVAFLADALIEQGDLAEARDVVDSAGLSGTDIDLYIYAWSFAARARVRLAEGEADDAFEGFVALGRYLEDLGVRNPAIFAWRSEAALALHALGRGEEANRYAAEELALARQWDAPRALGKSLIAAGLMEEREDGITPLGLALLREAVAVLESSPARLEHARALVELGSALRRRDRGSDARGPLRRGLELATICGAASLAQRAEAELLATGARPRRTASSGVESLTPSERRVAEMAAEGGTNREIAQALFVTPKTVEVHLSRAYRKLKISSRRDLATSLTSLGRAI